MATTIGPHSDADLQPIRNNRGEVDLWNFPSVIPHSIQGLNEGCEFLLAFDNGSFSENETFLLTDLFNHRSERSSANGHGQVRHADEL